MPSVKPASPPPTMVTLSLIFFRDEAVAEPAGGFFAYCHWLSAGQSAESSRPTKPARTLTDGIVPGNTLHPTRQSIRAAMRARTGSGAARGDEQVRSRGGRLQQCRQRLVLEMVQK